MQKGISAILIAPHTVAPCWVEKDSVTKFVDEDDASDTSYSRDKEVR